MIPGLLIVALVIWTCREAHEEWGNRAAAAVATGFVFALFVLGSV